MKMQNIDIKIPTPTNAYKPNNQNTNIQNPNPLPKKQKHKKTQQYITQPNKPSTIFKHTKITNSAANRQEESKPKDTNIQL